MKNLNPSRALAIAAGLVIIALTGAAFWLSYAHLAEVALGHGLGEAEVRAWAWPACLDLFIMAGELMWLRAALAHRVDLWAIGLTAVGSLGSIVLNVAGVTGARDPGAVPLLDYVVAAVPPTAALLAFGALMRQVHQALAGHAEQPAATNVDVSNVGHPEQSAMTGEVAVERADDDRSGEPFGSPDEPLEVVTPPVIELPAASPVWDDFATSKVTAAVPAETPREVVTEQITLTPSDLRRKARAMHRQVVKSGGRGVTIDQLRESFGLSRREATDLRREVVTEVAS
ncbi:DUF2637 domain-containing protein [Streptomyces sp. NPDC059165]|uniref:DUF2637 domain-containing protein n=1 Tax=Streptomyces sp. NPDC059165 TaxID=3346751 RepID=UPI0036B14C26